MTRFAIALLAAGCATAYAPLSMGTGYSDTQVGDNVFRVAFEANTSTSAERTSDYVMLRSAEVALTHGFTHFTIEQQDNTAKVFTGKYGGTAPASQATILCYKGKPAGANGLFYEAALIKQTMRAKYDIHDPPPPEKPDLTHDVYGNEIVPKKK